MRRALIAVMVGIIAAGCGGGTKTKHEKHSSDRQIRAECYSVTSFDVKRSDGVTESHNAVDLDEKGRVLVNVGQFCPGTEENPVPASAFIWDGKRNNLPIPSGFDEFFADDMNERGEVVGRALRGQDGSVFVWRDGVPIDLGVGGHEVAGFSMTRTRTAINELGHVAGTYPHSDGTAHAFLYRGGDVTDLGRGSAEGLNDADWVVGLDEQRRPWVWHDGARTELGAPPASDVGSAFINGSGQVALTARTGEEVTHAFFWSAGTLTDLGTFGGDKSTARALNDRGDVVGEGGHGFLWNDGTSRDLGALTTPHGINERRQVVGLSARPIPNPPGETIRTISAFLWDDGTMIELPKGAFGKNGLSATRINESAVVIGRDFPDEGDCGSRALLWKPDLCPNGQPVPDAGPGETGGDAGAPPPPPPEEPIE